MRQSGPARIVCSLAFAAALFLIISAVSRYLMLQAFAPDDLAKLTGAEKYDVFRTGTLYDIRAFTLTFAPFLLVMLLGSVFRSPRTVGIAFRTGGVFTAFVLIVFSVINFYFYRTYNSYIDVFIFSAFDEDAEAVMKTVVHDYPLGRALIAAALGLLLLIYIFRKADALFSGARLPWNTRAAWGKVLPGVLVLIVIAVYVIGTRGSVGRFPLRRNDAAASRFRAVNMSLPNSLMAFYWAVSDRRNTKRLPEAENDELRKLARNVGIEADISDPSGAFRQKVPGEARSLRDSPNVVFAVMESMSTHMLRFDDPASFDLMGSLRGILGDGYHFRNFLSEGDGTMDTLARLLIRGTRLDVSVTDAKRAPFLFNAVKPFKEKGYKLVFITSGSAAWRNIGEFLTFLGFDEIDDEHSIENKYPEAKAGAWGVPDGFMFRFASDRLEKARKKGEKVFILMLSTTNHGPYLVPKSYHGADFEIPEKALRRFPLPDIRQMFRTFRYANDMLGTFISDELKGSGRDDTVIAFTGDHNVRGLNYTRTSEALLGHSVPFWIYVPEKFRKGAAYDGKKFASQMGIFPTLYGRALPGSDFVYPGCDILSDGCEPSFAFNAMISGINGKACLIDEPAFSWSGMRLLRPDDLELDPSAPVGKDDRDCRKARSFEELLDWYCRYAVVNLREKKSGK